MQAEGKKLAKQAKNSDVNMFANNIFPKYFEKVAQKCYTEQMDSFQKLFEDPQFFKRVREEMGRAMYFNFKNGEANENELRTDKLEYPIQSENLPVAAEGNTE